MREVYTCPQGHQWERSPTQNPEDTALPVACPVCGLAGQTSLSPTVASSLVPDELPPLPRKTSGEATFPAGTGELAAEIKPDLVPGYEILGELGRGGMGVVYRAIQLSLKRVVALKMILASSHTSRETLQRFRSEAETIAAMRHPNIIHIYDVMSCQGIPCFSMEFVEGGSLEQRIANKPMPAGSAARLSLTLARAVQAAHQGGIIHRDLKPANILLTEDGTPKITDFGLAKRLDQEGVQTRSGYIMGTPHYMAPEQAEGDSKRFGPATDVYALGAILYEMLTGKPPFRGETTSQILKQVLFDEPTPPGKLQAGIPAGLEAICLKCLQKDPARRYLTAGELAEALDRFLAAPTATEIIQPARPAPKRTRTWLLAGGLSLVLVAGLAFVPPIRDWLFTPNRGNSPIDWKWEVLAPASTDKEEVFDRIAFPTRDTGYLASRKALYQTQDGGKNWKKLKLETPGRIHLLHFQDTQIGWLGTDKLLQTTNGGETWQEVSLGEKMRSVTALALHSEGWGLVGGTNADGKRALFHRDNAGAKWQTVVPSGDLPSYESWYVGSLTVTGPGSALAVLFHGVEEGGVVLRTADGGKSWTKVFTAAEDLYRLHLDNSGQGWLIGFGGTLWHSGDGGKTWQPHDNPDQDGATPTCLAFDSTGKLGLAPLWKGAVLVKTPDQPWKHEAAPLGYALPHAVVVDPGCAFVLAADGSIARLLVTHQP